MDKGTWKSTKECKTEIESYEISATTLSLASETRRDPPDTRRLGKINPSFNVATITPITNNPSTEVNSRDPELLDTDCAQQDLGCCCIQACTCVLFAAKFQKIEKHVGLFVLASVLAENTIYNKHKKKFFFSYFFFFEI